MNIVRVNNVVWRIDDGAVDAVMGFLLKYGEKIGEVEDQKEQRHLCDVCTHQWVGVEKFCPACGRKEEPDEP